MKRILILFLIVILGCSQPPPVKTKEDFKPTIRDLGGGWYAFDRSAKVEKADQVGLANEALQDTLGNWTVEHSELEIRFVMPLESTHAYNSQLVTSLIIFTKKK